jgi:hypothetical protein
MNWLAGFTVRVAEIEIDTHHIISADSEQRAEWGAQEMGRTWWERPEEEVDGSCWRFPEGEVSYFSLVPLADVETRILLDLKFLDRWCVTVSQDKPRICDAYGCHWRDFRR